MLGVFSYTVGETTNHGVYGGGSCFPARVPALRTDSG